MGRTACTEPQCPYKGDLYLYFLLCSLKMFQSVLFLGTPIQIKFISLQNLKTDRYCFLGEPDRTPLYVGLPSAWGSMDGDCIFPHISWEGSLLGTRADENECINHWLWKRSITLHRDPVGGTWRGGSLRGDFERFCF